MHNYYKFKDFGEECNIGEEYNIWLQPREYNWNGKHNLAVQAWTEDGEPLAVITVNLPDEELSGDESCTAFIDVNNVPEIYNFLIANDIANFTGKTAISGYCEYPEFKFNLEKLG